MAICTATALNESAACFNCLTDSQKLAIQTALLQELVDNTQTVAQLMTASKCFLCMDDHQLRAIQAYLLCQLVD